MSFDEFFTDGDKPYSENLNDSLVLTDAFDLSVPLCMPDGFSNGEFSSTLNVTRKCNVGLVTLKSVGSGVTVGTSQISGSGEVVFRVYPNFNCFYKWDKILLEKSGTVDISFRKPDGSGITATVGVDGIISDNNALKQLQEIDVVFTLSSATINNILIWFVNNQGTRNRTGARLEASQLANVNGTVTANDDKAVNGGTVKTALDDLHTTVTGEIEDLSDSVTANISSLTSSVALKEDKSNKVTSLDSSDTHYPTSKAVKTAIDTHSHNNHSIILNKALGSLTIIGWYNEDIKMVQIMIEGTISWTGSSSIFPLANLNNAYVPPVNVNSDASIETSDCKIRVTKQGYIQLKGSSGVSYDISALINYMI